MELIRVKSCVICGEKFHTNRIHEKACHLHPANDFPDLQLRFVDLRQIERYVFSSLTGIQTFGLIMARTVTDKSRTSKTISWRPSSGHAAVQSVESPILM